jgi:hypothetical protein
MEVHSSVVGIVALCGALAVLGVFALVDAYAVHRCFYLARNEIPLPDLCSAEHLFRTSLEIGGMAIGLYGVSKVMKS